ncbi:hypothetical protein LTR66_016491, partial [Elasticomyces elasticus]
MANRSSVFDSRSSSPPLPRFGIHDLSEHSTSPALVRITKKQYDNTIKSQPDAHLLYVDEDDGEIVTVGSSYELSERLKERILQRETKNPLTGECVHVFDIRQTSGARTTWRDHEAYSSKFFVKHSSPSSVSDEADSPAVKFEITNLASSVEYDLDCEADKVTTEIIKPTALESFKAELEKLEAARKRHELMRPVLQQEITQLQHTTSTSQPHHKSISSKSSTIEEMIRSQEPTSPTFESLGASIASGLSLHLNGLATILELASEGLRKAAEKTKETDTSMVEDVLKGVHSIFTEVGSLAGSSFDEAFKTIKDNKVVGDAQSVSTYQPPSVSDEAVEETVEALPRTDPEAETEPQHSLSVLSDPEDLALYDGDIQSAVPKVRFESSRPFKPSTVDWPSPRVAEKKREQGGAKGKQKATDESTESFEDKKQRHEHGEYPSDGNKSSKGSILDAEHSDGDFTARYPPLMSVRRSNTTGGVSARVFPLRTTFDTRPIDQEAQKPTPCVRPVSGSVNTESKFVTAEAEWTARKPLPGAWPDTKTESATPLAASKESS